MLDLQNITICRSNLWNLLMIWKRFRRARLILSILWKDKNRQMMIKYKMPTMIGELFTLIMFMTIVSIHSWLLSIDSKFSKLTHPWYTQLSASPSGSYAFFYYFLLATSGNTNKNRSFLAIIGDSIANMKMSLNILVLKQRGVRQLGRQLGIISLIIW